MRAAAAFTILLATSSALAADSSCVYGGRDPNRERVDTQRRLSITAEAVTGGGRRRAVSPPVSSTLPIENFIDQHISDKLKKDKVQPTNVAGDEEFLRRVTIDLTGQIPTPAEVTAFLADTSKDKRAKKVDELLATEAFVDRWTMWFGDLVQNVQFSNNSAEFYIGRNAYYIWIKDSIRANKPYDAMVRELLAGQGDSFAVGVANYVVRQIQNNGPIQDTYDNLAAHSAEKFLGMPVLCLSCHGGAGHLELVNWYLRGKTRKDFWAMAAFFSRTQARLVRAVDPISKLEVPKFEVTDNPTGVYRLNTNDGNKTPRQPAAGESNVVTPAFLTTGATLQAGENARQAYGHMLTADKQFARATVNYLWKEMFGLGLVEPVNAFDLSKLDTQPTHPALLEALADEFIANAYSLKSILRTMALSSTYQLSAQYVPGNWNEAYVPYFARRYPRRIMAEALLDAVVRATNTPFSITVQGLGPINKAMQLPDPLEGGTRQGGGAFLSNFGRGDRDDVARTNDSSISQSLAMMNDPFVTNRVRRATRGSTLEQILAATQDPPEVVDRIYLATLSRRPAAHEKEVALELLRSGGVLGDRAEDLQYVLLNSLEFLFN